MTKQQRKFYLLGVVIMLVPNNGVFVEEISAGKWRVGVMLANTEYNTSLTDADITKLTAKELAKKVSSGLRAVK